MSSGRPHRLYLAPALLVVAVAVAHLPCPRTVRADDGLADLLKEWELVSRRRDERGWKEQDLVLTRIADLDTQDSRRALARLRDRAGRGDWRRARLILSAMARHASPEDLDEIVHWVETGKDGYLREGLGEVLAAARDPGARAWLRGKGLQKATPDVKAQIARALGMQGDPAATTPLLFLLREDFVRVRVEALEALGTLGDGRALGPVVVFLRDRDARVRDAAARALGSLGGERSGEALASALDDDSPRVVESAAASLGLLGDPRWIPALIQRLRQAAADDQRVAHACALALEAISGVALGVDPVRWSMWWEAVKDRPFERADPGREPPEGRTVPANRYYGFPIRSSRVVFVLDGSRSMGWNGRLENAQAELLRVIERLPPSTRFNIVTFSDRARAWSEKGLQEADANAIRKASSFVRRQRPDNGTNTWAALQLALADDEADTVFFLSDGQPSVGTLVEPDLILAELRKQNRYRRVRIHCVALLLGTAPTGFAGMEDMEQAEAFMRRLATEHDGEFKAVK